MWQWRSAVLTHRGQMTHICISNHTIIGSDNGLSPGRRQAIIWTNAGILLFGPSGTNISEIAIEILTCSFKKMRLKVSSAKWRPYCFGLNVLTVTWYCLYQQSFVSEFTLFRFFISSISSTEILYLIHVTLTFYISTQWFNSKET